MGVQGSPATDENLAGVAEALTPEDDPAKRDRILLELRRLYWTSDVAGILERHLGAEVVSEILGRVNTYASLACRLIDDRIAPETRADVLSELATLGAHSEFAGPLLSALATNESDDDWRNDLLAASSDWVRRVLTVNLQVHQAEEDTLIQDTEGRLLKNWDVSNPKAYAHYQRSMQLQVEGRLDEAVAEVARAAELDPLDPANHFTLGSAKGTMGAQTGDRRLVREGLEACWLAVTLDPNWILPWTEIGWVLLKTGRAREAVEHLKAVSPGCGPLDSRYYTALGTALHQLGRYDDALAALESALELEPEDPTVASAAAMTALLTDDKVRSSRHAKTARHLGAAPYFDTALELMKTVRAGTPPDANAHLRRAVTLFENGEDGRAIAELDKLIRLGPDNVSAYLFRGIVHGYTGRYDRAILDTSEAIRLDPGNATAYYFRGMNYGEQDAFDRALADMDETIRLEPENGDAHRVRGDCRRYMGEYELAIADFNIALRIDPGDASSYRSRGAANRMTLEFERAIADYEIALRLSPKDPLTHRFRGDAYLGNGDFSRAIADFDITLGIDDTDGIAYLERAEARLYSGEFDLTIADFNAAVKCNPESAQAYHGRGLAREFTGDRDGAEDDFRRAKELGYDEGP